MVGDRYFTDVVYGNRLGMLSVRVAPFTTAGETRVVTGAQAGGRLPQPLAPGRRAVQAARARPRRAHRRLGLSEVNGRPRGELNHLGARNKNNKVQEKKPPGEISTPVHTRRPGTISSPRIHRQMAATKSG